jgi:hypothetical protein
LCNDIAIQVFNFEFNYFSSPEGSSTTISGNGLHKIIPGYHYCDRMMAAGAGDNDRIMILAGDGSLITFPPLLVLARNETAESSLEFTCGRDQQLTLNNLN